MAYTAAGIACVGAIAGLASQKTARFGNALGVTGVATGIAATVGAAHASVATIAQMTGM
jgi:NAD(P) transhydrogenase